MNSLIERINIILGSMRTGAPVPPYFEQTMKELDFPFKEGDEYPSVETLRGFLENKKRALDGQC